MTTICMLETDHYFFGGVGGGVEKFPNTNFFCNYSYSNDFIFQGNFAANNCFSTFISWICDFATAFNNA